MKIILASESQRRRELLKKINLKFKVIPSSFDESKVEIYHNSPEKYCSFLAYQKALDVSKKYPESTVIGSDTIVYNNSRILGKPIDEKDAFKQLKLLSGKTHIVFTAVHIINKKINLNKKIIDSTKVTFNQLNDEDILFYIKNYKPFDKAGSYGIQDWSSIFVKKIDGCFYNVVGFPLPKFYKLMYSILK